MTINLNQLNPNTPVIVGIGFCQIKSDNPQDCPGPLDMMLNAIEQAADDAGTRGLLTKLDYIGVQKGSWEYRNPGKMLADKFGCSAAKSVLSEVGVLQLMVLMELCQDIAKGVRQIGVVVGSECRYRDLRCLITGEKIEDTKEAENTPAPDVFYSTPDPFFTDFEVGRGIWDPIELYSVCESTIRKNNGLSIDQHRDAIASLYSHFSEMAVALIITAP